MSRSKLTPRERIESLNVPDTLKSLNSALDKIQAMRRDLVNKADGSQVLVNQVHRFRVTNVE